MPESISFGTWLRQKRRSLDLTQKAFADRVGCAEITVRRMEADEYKPSKELALTLFEKLGIPGSERSQWISFARGMSSLPIQSIPDANKPKTNLPASLSSFIGREQEQTEIMGLIAKNRLVTLVGTGGMGKTRLALQVGQRLLNNYPDGVWFVSLDSLSNPMLVPSTVASIFDIRERPDRSVIEILKNLLREKTTLLILDSCEHLLEPCAQLIISLLTYCQNLKIFVTSREIVNMEGEAAYYLPSLSIPENDGILAEKMNGFESVRLFEERAALAISSFRLTEQNTQTVVDICRRIDGIPLAIELAAARVDILQVNEILEQLNHCFDLLANNRRATLPRHQTMRASMDWSWGLLTQSEQTFLRRLSVFAGGWTLESAQAVCEGDAFNLTSALVKKSLIIVNQELARETRFRFHEIVRQYARERLTDAGEEENICTRHLNHFLHFSELAEPALRGPAQIEWMSRLNDERDNIRTALDWADKTDVEAGLYISGRLWRFWEDVDLREGENWLKRFLDTTESHHHPHARAKALYAYGIILYLTVQYVPMREITEECLASYRSLGDLQGEIDGLILSARLRFATSDMVQTIELVQQALALSKSLGDVWRQAFALGHLGWADQDYSRRISSFKEAVSLFRKVGDLRELQEYLGTLGNYEMLGGDIESAQEHVNEAMLLSQNSYFKGAMHFLSALGRIESLKGNFEKARGLLEKSIENADELGFRNDSLWDRAHLSHIIVKQGQFFEASEIFLETTQDFFKAGNVIGVCYSLEGMAGLYAATNKPAVAAQLIGWADATRQKIQDTRPRLEQADVDKIIAACLKNMGEVAFADAYDEGAKMTLDEAVAFALE
jgi:predicted ATPase/DNA-binding XRE family transcriptional regulator